MKNILSLIGILALLAAGCSKDQNVATPDNGIHNATGTGGSLARFTTTRNHLYVVDDQKLYTYSLANPQEPKLANTLPIGFDVETLYPYNDKLFIGSQIAMYVFSIQSPESPQLLGTASHIRACDPVVADDYVAYVTVRSGTTCGGTINALLVYDISGSLLNPTLGKQINLTNPWGLGMKGNRLYVCDGSSGLFIFDISERNNPVFIKKISGETFYDVIVTDDVLVCMVNGGTALYEWGSDDNLVKVATIK